MGQVTIQNARFSYAYIFQPQKPGRDGKAGKYQVDILWNKNDQQTTAIVGQALQQTYAEAQADPKFADVMVRGTFKWDVIKDGARAKFGKPDYERYKDSYFVTAKSKQPVQVIDASGMQLHTDREFFSGCFGHAGVAFKLYAPTKDIPESGYGISCSLLALMKTGGTEADRWAGAVIVEANQFFGVQAQPAGMPGFPMPGQPQQFGAAPIPQYQPPQQLTAPQFQPQQPASPYANPAQSPGFPGQPQQVPTGAPGYGQPQQPAAPGIPGFGQQAQPYPAPGQQFGAPAPGFGAPQAPENFGAPQGNPFPQVAQPAQVPGQGAPQWAPQAQPAPGQHQPTPAWPGAAQQPAPQGFDPYGQPGTAPGQLPY